MQELPGGGIPEAVKTPPPPAPPEISQAAPVDTGTLPNSLDVTNMPENKPDEVETPLGEDLTNSLPETAELPVDIQPDPANPLKNANLVAGDPTLNEVKQLFTEEEIQQRRLLLQEAAQHRAEANREADTPIESAAEVQKRLDDAWDETENSLVHQGYTAQQEGRWSENRDQIKAQLIKDKYLDGNETDKDVVDKSIDKELERRSGINESFRNAEAKSKATEAARLEIESEKQKMQQNGIDLSEDGENVIRSKYYTEDKTTGTFTMPQKSESGEDIPPITFVNARDIPRILNGARDLMIETENVDGEEKPTERAKLVKTQLHTLEPYLSSDKDGFIARTEIEMDPTERREKALRGGYRIINEIRKKAEQDHTEGKTIEPSLHVSALIHATNELDKEKSKGADADKKKLELLTAHATMCAKEWMRTDGKAQEFQNNKFIQDAYNQLNGNFRYYAKEGNDQLKHIITEELKNQLGVYNFSPDALDHHVNGFLNSANLGSTLYIINMIGPYIEKDLKRAQGQPSHVDAILNAVTGEAGLLSAHEANMIRMLNRCGNLGDFREKVANALGVDADALVHPDKYFTENANSIFRHARREMGYETTPSDIERLLMLTFANEEALKNLKDKANVGNRLLMLATLITMLEGQLDPEGIKAQFEQNLHRPKN